MSTHHTPETVHLKCGHEALYYPLPKVGDIVYCRKCRRWAVVLRLQEDDEHFTVECDVCKFKRQYASSEETVARVKGETHHLRYDHLVWLIHPDGSRVVI